MKKPELIKQGLGVCGKGVCEACPYPVGYNCQDDLMIDALAHIQQLERERDAAVKVAQRFSYCNEHKCRWCRFGVLREDKKWGCSHPKKEKFYGDARCTCFEYQYKEGD